MDRTITGYLSRIADTFARQGKTVSDSEKKESDGVGNQELIQSLYEAMREWNIAQQYFDSVSDPELVDYAVYSLEASKKKYTYLLKKARDMGIKIEIQ